MSAPRDHYADVGQAMRRAIDALLAREHTAAEADTLLAILRETAAWSRRTEQISPQRLAELTGRHRASVFRALALLELDVIHRRRGGRHRAPTIELPPGLESHSSATLEPDLESRSSATQNADLESQSSATAESHSSATPGSHSSATPYEKSSEKTAEKAAAASNGSTKLPDGLAPLLARLGAPLHASQLQRATAAYRDDPAHVARSLDEALAGGANPVALFDAKLRAITIAPGPRLSLEERVRRWLHKYGGGFDPDDLPVIIEDEFGLDAATAERLIREWREETAAC